MCAAPSPAPPHLSFAAPTRATVDTLMSYLTICPVALRQSRQVDAIRSAAITRTRPQPTSVRTGLPLRETFARAISRCPGSAGAIVSQFLLNLLQLGAHAAAAGRPPDLEAAAPGFAADQHKPQKFEFFDHGRAVAPCVTAPFMLPSALPTASAPAISHFRGSIAHPTPIVVYASPAVSPPPTNTHYQAGATPDLGPDLHRLDRASFAWRTGSWVKQSSHIKRVP
jgi:hypothetical protein